MAKMWGGRFTGDGDPAFKALNDSLRFDYRLLPYDVQGSIAWAKSLTGAGVLSASDATKIAQALEEILAGADPDAVASSGEEDVHSWVEARLIERLGDLGKRLHTGRSRNDQVATDLRLYARAEAAARMAEVRAAQAALVRLAEREIDTPFPSYTHLQRAQPVLFAHWCMAHFEALDRDAARFEAARASVALCPLGSAALTGTTLPIDRDALAKDLGFDGPTRNSLDAVSDRDFVLDLLAASATCAVHLSRLAEDLILYSSAEFGLIEMSEAVTSGSSIMPQKKNPDAMELLRAKCGRVVGSLTSMLITLKGLPGAYNKDLQEDKEPLFDAMAHLSLCLRVLPTALDGLTLRHDRCAEAAVGGYANATELADYLAEKGVPFRDAHEIVGALVRNAIERGIDLESFTADELKAHHPAIGDDVRDRLSLGSALQRRGAFGGTAPERVREAVRDAGLRLKAAQHGGGAQ